MILVKITVCDHVFDGVMHGKPALSEAEAVFTTSHSGYVESCTDPSYSMQALVFAHSVIGAHGIYENAKQSSVFWPAFVIATQPSADFIKWAVANDGCVITVPSAREIVELSRNAATIKLSGNFLIRDSSQLRYHSDSDTNADLLVIDFGCKNSLLTSFHVRGISTSVQKSQSLSASDVRDFRGAILLSSEPGDPRTDTHGCHLTEAAVSVSRAVFGVCYGHQLLSIVHGCDITKMALGHRGANHPVISLSDRAIMITSHNHGFTVADNCHISKQEITYRSLLDDTIEGISTDRFMSVQFHPEGHPGPRVPSIIESMVSKIRSHRGHQE